MSLVNAQSKFHSGICGGSYIGKENAVELSLGNKRRKDPDNGRKEKQTYDNRIKKEGIIANLNNAIRMFDENVSTKDVIKFTRIPEENAQYISSLSGNGYTHNEILEFVLKKFYPNIIN